MSIQKNKNMVTSQHLQVNGQKWCHGRIGLRFEQLLILELIPNASIKHKDYLVYLTGGTDKQLAGVGFEPRITY